MAGGIQAGSAYIPVSADMSQFGKQVEQGTSKAQGKIAGFAKTAGAALGGVFVASKVKDFFGGAVSGAREAIAIDKQTQAVIESTGGAAGVTAGHIDELAGKLQKAQTINDEVTQSGANLILTFTNIKNAAGEGNDIFDQTVELANDMSVALGQDMKSSSIQLGKALNDPVKGVSALQRVGVSFTESQKEQIKTLVESGDTLGAQKLILAELDTQFGGSAAAQADAGKKMSLAWDDFKEVIGRLVVPIVDKLMAGLTKVTEWAAENPGKLQVIAGVIGGALVAAFTAWAISAAAAAAANTVAVAKMVAGWVMASAQAMFHAARIAAAWLIAMGPIGLIVAAVVGLVALIVVHFDTIKDVIGKAWEFVKTVTGAAWDWISEKISGVVDFIAGLPEKISSAASGMWDGIKKAFRAVINFIIDGWNGLEFKIPGFKIGPVGYDGFTLGLPDIPRLHSGGWVTSDMPRFPGLAANERPIIAEVGELVSPASGTTAGGATTVNLYYPERESEEQGVLRALRHMAAS